MIWFGVLVLFALYLSIAPIVIDADSTTGLFRIRYHRLASAKVILPEGSIVIDFRMMFWHYQFDLLDLPEKRPVSTSMIRKKKTQRIPFERIMAFIRSFTIQKFNFSLDTGSPQWNGILFPLFFHLGRKYELNLAVNFVGKNELKLQVKNTIARMMWAYIRS